MCYLNDSQVASISVQEFRKEQALKKEADKELASVDDQLDQSDREWTITLRSMTDKLNKKIVSVLQMGKLINELKEEVSSCEISIPSE